MPGDYSRKTFNREKHYSGVLMQQGRVQLDADWNEQVALQLYRTELEAIDVIGSCGVPKKVDGFRIGLTPSALDLTISPGRMYVEGLLCELEATPVSIRFVSNAPNQATVETLSVAGSKLAQGQWVELSAANKTSTKLLQIANVEGQSRTLTFNTSISDFQNSGAASIRRVATLLTQPEFPGASITGLGGGAGGTLTTSPLASPLTSPPQALLADGLYLVFIHAWKREITALDDPHVREVALGGPDTATRLKNIWQVKLLSVTPLQGTPTCKSRYTEWDNLVAPSTGRLNARTKPPDDEKDPCLLPPTAGFTRLENQLYRVEVQRAGDRQTAAFKWSRDNAIVRTNILNVNSAVLTVADVGRDDVLGFAGGQWVEIIDEESVLKRGPRQLFQVDGVDATTGEITLKSTPSGLANRKNLQLVRWDQFGDTAGVDGVTMSSGTDWIDLEGGVQVKFSEGIYRAGDHWLIPARTATGEIEWPPFAIPNNEPEAQPPLGIQHHFCRLALIEVADGIINLKDCRRVFPSLTDISAEDVCFDNDNCKLPGVETVQEALDRLCAARDLRFHNKYLHGWGIVCGLQVECGPDGPGQPRRHITVRKGYAIDCEGNDIILDQNESLDLVALAGGLASPLASPLTSPPMEPTDDELALFIELDGQQQPRFRVERYTPPINDWQSLLQGTLLADFINDCILKLGDFFKEEFTVGPDEVKRPVGPARKRLTTFLNLIVQLFNPTNGSFVFISREEDQILRSFYSKLRAMLQSHTFCAMFDGARQFPDEYPFAKQDIVTIFGKGSQQRLRISPNGRVGYAVGGGSNKIAVYYLGTNEMTAELEFPGGSNALVQDVAFSKDGVQLYAVATINNKDSSFATADVSGLNHVWRHPTVICDVQLITLGTAPSVSNDVYAVGKGKGLYQINPENINATPTPIGTSFVATGHLTIFPQEKVAYAAASEAGAAPNLYNSIVRINLESPANNPPAIPLRTSAGQPVAGQDDIALGFPAGQGVRLYVVVNPPSGFVNKQVMIFDAAGGQLLGQSDLGEGNTDICLAFNPATKLMVVVYEESYRLTILDAKDAVEPSFRFPVQISPLSIAVAPNNKRVYVLNFASNTVSSISAGLLAPNRQLSMNDLVEYRTAALNAFFDLAGGFLQYLKDCLCDHFLVNCPTCQTGDKLYLAVISIKNRQVHKICNFSLRKYVKSFPTIEYWLSLVPILPLVSKAFEVFCCAALPNFFGRQNAPHAEVKENEITLGDNRIKSSSVRSGVEFFNMADFGGVTREVGTKIRSGVPLVFDAVTKGTRGEAVSPPRLVHSDVAGQSVEAARRKLDVAKINVVQVEPYDPGAGAANLVEFSRAPLRLEEGAQIKLITKDDKVLYYSVVEIESPQIKALRKDIEATKTAVAEAAPLRSEVDALKKVMLEMEKKHREVIASRDKEIAELKVSANDIQLNILALNKLKEQVAKLSKGGKATRSPKGKDEPEV